MTSSAGPLVINSSIEPQGMLSFELIVNLRLTLHPLLQYYLFSFFSYLLGE